MKPGAEERQLTQGAGGRILTNANVWSPDGQWIVYDNRSSADGSLFDGNRIELINAVTGEQRTLYQSAHGAHCGVATFHPTENNVVFILGPENPTDDWQYCAWHRQGVIVDAIPPHSTRNLDARDLTPPFTPGALRGGSHVHMWDPAGDWVSFTYEDHLLAKFTEENAEHEINLRNVGVSVPGRFTKVNRGHPRNHDAHYCSVLVTRTVAHPQPGSDEIKRACEEGWIGHIGYVKPDGSRQRRALAFQGEIVTAQGQTLSEVFVADLPDDLTTPGDGPLAGTETTRPKPPRGTIQRRLSFTADRKFPGIQGPRHWLRSSPDGRRIAFLMKDEAGLVQLWTLSPNGGVPEQITRNPFSISSAFTWSPDGQSIAHVMDGSVCVTSAATGETRRLTFKGDTAEAPRPEACVFSPDGAQIAFIRRVSSSSGEHNQICVVRT